MPPDNSKTVLFIYFIMSASESATGEMTYRIVGICSGLGVLHCEDRTCGELREDTEANLK